MLNRPQGLNLQQLLQLRNFYLEKFNSPLKNKENIVAPNHQLGIRLSEAIKKDKLVEEFIQLVDKYDALSLELQKTIVKKDAVKKANEEYELYLIDFEKSLSKADSTFISEQKFITERKKSAYCNSFIVNFKEQCKSLTALFPRPNFELLKQKLQAFSQLLTETKPSTNMQDHFSKFHENESQILLYLTNAIEQYCVLSDKLLANYKALQAAAKLNSLKNAALADKSINLELEYLQNSYQQIAIQLKQKLSSDVTQIANNLEVPPPIKPRPTRIINLSEGNSVPPPSYQVAVSTTSSIAPPLPPRFYRPAPTVPRQPSAAKEKADSGYSVR